MKRKTVEKIYPEWLRTAAKEGGKKGTGRSKKRGSSKYYSLLSQLRWTRQKGEVK